jgi:light-independent protochlorophyllide reductase subunit B
MFQDDFEFGNDVGPSHRAGAAFQAKPLEAPAPSGNGTTPAPGSDPAAATTGAPTADAPSGGAGPSRATAAPETTPHHGTDAGAADGPAPAGTPAPPDGDPVWTPAAEKELSKIPFFVRKKARRNTEAFAVQQGLGTISVDTLYEAKAHFGGR